MKVLKVPLVQLSVLSLISFFVAFFFNFTSDNKIQLIFSPETSILVFTLAIIGMAFMFFGYGTPVMMVFAGLYAGLIYPSSQIFAVSAAAIAFIVAYASIRLGVALLHDLQGKESFSVAWKPLSMVVSTVIIFALLLEFLF